eukprot:tig00021181_g19319.t1
MPFVGLGCAAGGARPAPAVPASSWLHCPSSSRDVGAQRPGLHLIRPVRFSPTRFVASPQRHLAPAKAAPQLKIRRSGTCSVRAQRQPPQRSYDDEEFFRGDDGGADAPPPSDAQAKSRAAAPPQPPPRAGEEAARADGGRTRTGATAEDWTPGRRARPRAPGSAKEAFIAACEEADEGRGEALFVKEELQRLLRELPQGRHAPAMRLEEALGTWRVLYAPHIRQILEPVTFSRYAIRYTLRGVARGALGAAGPEVAIESNVDADFLNGLLSGSLNASGRMVAAGEDEVQVLFNRFWVNDPKPPGDGRVVNVAGRALFVPRFSYFPVLFLDEDLAVFEFKPLKSLLVVRREAGQGSLAALPRPANPASGPAPDDFLPD